MKTSNKLLKTTWLILCLAGRSYAAQQASTQIEQLQRFRHIWNGLYPDIWRKILNRVLDQEGDEYTLALAAACGWDNSIINAGWRDLAYLTSPEWAEMLHKFNLRRELHFYAMKRARAWKGLPDGGFSDAELDIKLEYDHDSMLRRAQSEKFLDQYSWAFEGSNCHVDWLKVLKFLAQSVRPGDESSQGGLALACALARDSTLTYCTGQGTNYDPRVVTWSIERSIYRLQESGYTAPWIPHQVFRHLADKFKADITHRYKVLTVPFFGTHEKGALLPAAIGLCLVHSIILTNGHTLWPDGTDPESRFKGACAIPPEIGLITTLEKLKIDIPSGGHLERLPATIGSLASLQSCDITIGKERFDALTGCPRTELEPMLDQLRAKRGDIVNLKINYEPLATEQQS